MPIRSPAVAGTFYPSDALGLKRAVEGAYLHRLGPGRLPPAGRRDGARGLAACISPHAGYAYSGPVAAHSYLHVSEASEPGLVVVVGPNHYGVGSGVATYGEGGWETPLGTVAIDGDSTKAIVRLTGFVDVDPAAHTREHSIEVQLPFLQMIYGTSFSLLPICLAFQDKATARDLAKALTELLREAKEAGRGAVLVGSSDLTHYEPATQAREKDADLLRHVQSLDADSFYATLERREVTACGYGAIATVMETCRLLGYKGGRLNAYHTSGDVTGDDSAVVGYPSVSFT